MRKPLTSKRELLFFNMRTLLKILKVNFTDLKFTNESVASAEMKFRIEKAMPLFTALILADYRWGHCERCNIPMLFGTGAFRLGAQTCSASCKISFWRKRQ